MNQSWPTIGRYSRVTTICISIPCKPAAPRLKYLAHFFLLTSTRPNLFENVSVRGSLSGVPVRWQDRIPFLGSKDRDWMKMVVRGSVIGDCNSQPQKYYWFCCCGSFRVVISKVIYSERGLNSRPLACKASVITTRLSELDELNMAVFVSWKLIYFWPRYVILLAHFCFTFWPLDVLRLRVKKNVGRGISTSVRHACTEYKWKKKVVPYLVNM
jgi:hypothetical protein